MSGKWEKTFEVAVPVERLWRAFQKDDEYGRLLLWPDASAAQAAESARHKVIASEPMKRLTFEQDKSLPDTRAEFTIVFESIAGGSRFTVTRYSFGEGDEADVFAESNFLGFCHGFRDLIFYLETGKAARRHYQGCSQSAMGLLCKEREWGVEVLGVTRGGFADQAGLQRGDRLLRIGNVAIYSRNDVWSLEMEHPPGVELAIEYVRGDERRKSAARMSSLNFAAVGE